MEEWLHDLTLFNTHSVVFNQMNLGFLIVVLMCEVTNSPFESVGFSFH